MFQSKFRTGMSRDAFTVVDVRCPLAIAKWSDWYYCREYHQVAQHMNHASCLILSLDFLSPPFDVGRMESCFGGTRMNDEMNGVATILSVKWLPEIVYKGAMVEYHISLFIPSITNSQHKHNQPTNQPTKSQFTSFTIFTTSKNKQWCSTNSPVLPLLLLLESSLVRLLFEACPVVRLRQWKKFLLSGLVSLSIPVLSSLAQWHAKGCWFVTLSQWLLTPTAVPVEVYPLFVFTTAMCSFGVYSMYKTSKFKHSFDFGLSCSNGLLMNTSWCFACSQSVTTKIAYVSFPPAFF